MSKPNRDCSSEPRLSRSGTPTYELWVPLLYSRGSVVNRGSVTDQR